MWLKYIARTVLLVLLASSISAQQKNSWSWGAEETLDPKDPLPLETHSESRRAKELSSTSPNGGSEVVLEADSILESVSTQFEESGTLTSDGILVSTSTKSEKSDSQTSDGILDSTSTQFEESGALTSDDVNVSLEEGDSARNGRFLGLGDRLCSLGFGSNCKKNYQPAVQSHYGAPVKTLVPSGSYGPPAHLNPAGNYGPPPVAAPSGNYGPPPFHAPSSPSGNYGPPPVKGYAPPVKGFASPVIGYAPPAPVVVESKPSAKPPKGFLGSISDAVSSFIYKKPDAKPVAPYDTPKTEYIAPQPAYTHPKGAYSVPKGTPSKAVYTAPKPSYVAVEPAYTALKPEYNPPKPAYTAPKPTYNPPKPAYTAPKPAYVAVKPAYTAPKPAYNPPKPAYTAPKPTYNPPKAVYNTPKTTYTIPKATYAAPNPNPAYTAHKAIYAAPTTKPAYSVPKASYAAPKPAYAAQKATYAAPTPKPAYTVPKATYAAPKPAYTAPKATYAAPIPQPAYTVPKATYAAPKPAYTAPKPTYAAPIPQPAYTAPKATYAAPKPAYTAPKATYAAPKPAYATPKISYADPKPSFVAPTQSYAITKPMATAHLATVTVAQAQPVVHHVHTHTHVYQGVPSVATVHASPATAIITATPVIVSVPSVGYAQKSDTLIHSGSEQSIYVQAGTVVRLNEVKPYVEDCHCVPADFCPAGNIINPRNNPKDISHLLDARNSPSEIKSNATDINKTISNDESKRRRRNTDEEVSEENNDENVFSDRQGRRLKGITPGSSGCSAGYVCCRQPVYNPPKPKQTFVERQPTITIHSSTLVSPRPSNVAQQPKSLSTNLISNHKTSELKSHFAVKNDVQENNKPTVPVIASSSLHQQGPAYNEDCHCIPENFCSASDVVPRNSPKDISHLLDARNKDVDILSTATDIERVRRSTDNATLETTNNFTKSENSSDRQGRQLLGVTPDSFGCRQGYACCRRPVFNANKPKQISATPFNVIANTAAVTQKLRPVNSIITHSQIQPRPDVVIKQSTRTQTVVSPYSEDCQCIPKNFCLNNIVPRNSPKDISHLLDARNKGSIILSTASEERVRRSTNESSGNDTNNDSSARQARQLQGYTPGKEGCGIDYVCCRRLVFTPTRTQKAINRPSRRPIQVHSQHSPVVQVQRVAKPAILPTHTPKPVALVAHQSLLQHQVPAYREQCTCVAPNFCQQKDIIGRNSPSDISHLLDARNKGSSILSTASEERVRRSTNESSGNDTNNDSSARQARQLQEYTPGKEGCGIDYVCCRRPVFTATRTQKAINRPSRRPIQVHSQHSPVVQVQRVRKPAILPTHTPKPVVLVSQQSLLQHQIPAYHEQCTCVAPNFCQQKDIIGRSSPSDISHLLDARNKGSSILSTASEERVRRSTNESSGNDTNNDSSARQARQLQEYTPGKEGCGIDYVCCRRPVFTATRTQKAINRPSRRPIQIHSQHSHVVQVQRVRKPAILPTHTPKPVVLVAQQSLLQHQIPAYHEQCTCVAPNYCQQNNIIGRNSPSDISHLLDARNSAVNITSNATESRSRRSTNETESVNDETLYSDRQGRQVKSFPPGVGGCHAGTVCCRKPNFSVQNALLTASRPSVVVQTANVLQPRSKYTCGKSNSQSLLGRVKTPHFEQGDTEFGEYPWQAAILKMDDGDAQYVCGAALIDDQHLLTAAHCIDGIQPYNLKIRLGEWDVASESEFFSHIQIQVADVYIHKDYYKGNLQNDIAIMKLNTQVDFASNPHITPVCLPNPSADFHGQQCTVTGWGKDTFGSEGKFQKILKEVSVPVVDHRQCQDTLRTTRLGRSYSLDQGMLCAGGEEGKDACKGDGGSPLVCKGNDGAYQLTGLVSWGIGCGDRGIPGVYVNIKHYITWINAIQNS